MSRILDADAPQGELAAAAAAVDAALAAREATIARGDELPLIETVDAAIALTQRLVTAYVAAAGQKAPPHEDADFLEVFKVSSLAELPSPDEPPK